MSDPTNYVYVDIDGPVIKVYDADDVIPARDFIASADLRENSTDRVIPDAAERRRAAFDYAAKQAARLGIDWGSNE
jgi:hypothetical protein